MDEYILACTAGMLLLFFRLLVGSWPNLLPSWWSRHAAFLLLSLWIVANF